MLIPFLCCVVLNCRLQNSCLCPTVVFLQDFKVLQIIIEITTTNINSKVITTYAHVFSSFSDGAQHLQALDFDLFMSDLPGVQYYQLNINGLRFLRADLF